MEYIYAVLFNDKTVKFGRSVDVWHRLNAYEHESRRFGVKISSVLVSTVFDAPQCEKEIIDAATRNLKAVTKESFKFDKASEVADVFVAARFSFLALVPEQDRFGFKMTKESCNSRTALMEPRSNSRPASREDRIDARVAKMIDAYHGVFTQAVARNKLMTYTDDEVRESLIRLCDEGVIEKFEHIRSSDGYAYRTA